VGVANNQKCGVGVAFGAKIAEIWYPNCDIGLAMALSHMANGRGGVSGGGGIDIYVNTWHNTRVMKSGGGGGDDDDVVGDGDGVGGRRIVKMTEAIRKSMEEGITKGRKGKGSVYIFSVGNGGGECGMNEFVSSPWTLSVGSITHTGVVTAGSVWCNGAVAVVAPGSGDGVGLVTADIGNGGFGVMDRMCTDNVGGTGVYLCVYVCVWVGVWAYYIWCTWCKYVCLCVYDCV